jgi:hypothetical protein
MTKNCTIFTAGKNPDVLIKIFTFYIFTYPYDSIKGPPIDRRSLQPSKENIPDFKA